MSESSRRIPFARSSQDRRETSCQPGAAQKTFFDGTKLPAVCGRFATTICSVFSPIFAIPSRTDHRTRSPLLRVGQLQQLLAEVGAGEQPDDRLGRVLQPLLQIDLVLELALCVPLRHLGNRLGIALQE